MHVKTPEAQNRKTWSRRDVALACVLGSLVLVCAAIITGMALGRRGQVWLVQSGDRVLCAHMRFGMLTEYVKRHGDWPRDTSELKQDMVASGYGPNDFRYERALSMTVRQADDQRFVGDVHFGPTCPHDERVEWSFDSLGPAAQGAYRKKHGGAQAAKPSSQSQAKR